MLDQRGTGRSTPVGALLGMSAAHQADYLAHFRADSIVRDAEWIRRELGVDRWSVLGQSFGGLCVITYLSLAPEGLREALVTGGIPALGPRIDEVYARTYERVLDRNRRYYDRYPADRERVLALHDRIQDDELRLPCGDRLTWRRFRQLGQMLGMSDGAEHLHYIVELPPTRPRSCTTSRPRSRLPATRSTQSCTRRPGPMAARLAGRLSASCRRTSTLRICFTGEHVYPWMFEDYGALAPLRDGAHLLAEREWPRLYDDDVLRGNEVPAAAAIYLEDMYVERAFSEETASQIRGLRTWTTNEYQHNGLRVDGERILGRLLDLARGRA